MVGGSNLDQLVIIHVLIIVLGLCDIIHLLILRHQVVFKCYSQLSGPLQG